MKLKWLDTTETRIEWLLTSIFRKRWEHIKNIQDEENLYWRFIVLIFIEHLHISTGRTKGLTSKIYNMVVQIDGVTI